MIRSSLSLVLLLFALSFLVTPSAHARVDPTQDYCSQRSRACLTNCTNYNAEIFGISVPTPRTVTCVAECSIAYAGCLMMRFHQGV